MSNIQGACSTTTCILRFMDERDVILTKGGLGRVELPSGKARKGKTLSNHAHPNNHFFNINF